MSASIIEAAGLTKYYAVNQGLFAPQARLRAVESFSLAVMPGESVGIAGESGCGKSTVAKLLMKLIEPDDGLVFYNGTPLNSLIGEDLASFRKDVQMIFQDPYSSLNPRMRIGDTIGEPLLVHGLVSRSSYRRRVLELMAKVGLVAEHFGRYPHEFSGGQRQRIGIARALAVSPRLIIADEPVSALDLSIQAQIINLLQELKADLGLSLVFIAHDLSVVRHLCDRIVIMYLGAVMETGGRDTIFSKTLHPYTEALFSAVPRLTKSAREGRIILQGELPDPLHPPQGCPFHSRCPHVEEECRQKRPKLEEKEPGHWAACHFSEKIFRSG